MERIYPSYYKTFVCIAGACPDSCCHEWDVQVDAASAARYRSMEGPLGDALREHLYDEEGETYLRNVDGRCPMWRSDGLCRIQAEQGHDALCTVCQQFPRLRHDYGDFEELGLELSCPEAARIILESPLEWMHEAVSGGEEPDYDAEIMEILKESRPVALALLETLGEPVWEEGICRMAQYAVCRHWYQAVSDWDLSCRVKMLLSGCALVARLPGALVDRAQLWSKEIENSAENLNAILDGAYTRSALTDANLLGLLA